MAGSKHTPDLTVKPECDKDALKEHVMEGGRMGMWACGCVCGLVRVAFPSSHLANNVASRRYPGRGLSSGLGTQGDRARP